MEIIDYKENKEFMESLKSQTQVLCTLLESVQKENINLKKQISELNEILKKR